LSVEVVSRIKESGTENEVGFEVFRQLVNGPGLRIAGTTNNEGDISGLGAVGLFGSFVVLLLPVFPSRIGVFVSRTLQRSSFERSRSVSGWFGVGIDERRFLRIQERKIVFGQLVVLEISEDVQQKRFVPVKLGSVGNFLFVLFFERSDFGRIFVEDVSQSLDCKFGLGTEISDLFESGTSALVDGTFGSKVDQQKSASAAFVQVFVGKKIFEH